MALGPTVILRALTYLDKGPKTGWFSRVLDVGIISIFIYQADSDQLMNEPTAAVVIFFLYVRETSAVVSDAFTSV